MKSIWKTALQIAPAVAVVFLVGALAGLALQENARLVEKEKAAEKSEARHEEEKGPQVIYTCSMDPQIRWDHPGKCPICSMDLIPITGEEGIGLRVKPRYAQLAGIEVAPLLERALYKPIRVEGRLEVAHSRRRNLVAWTGGRLDELDIRYRGQTVEAGQQIGRIYSQELLASRDDYLSARARRIGMDPSSDPKEKARALAAEQAARTRLLRLGLSQPQLDGVVRGEFSGMHLPLVSQVSGTVLRRLVDEGDTVHPGHVLFELADLDTLWVVLRIYENEIPLVRVGQKVDVELVAFPGESFTGRIVFVEPDVHPDTRTVQARFAVDNRDGRLRPGMVAKATIRASLDPTGGVLEPRLGPYVCPRHPEVMASDPGRCPIDGEPLILRATLPEPQDVYTCAMECGHYDHAGPCPVCGMDMAALQPRTEVETVKVCPVHGDVPGAPGSTCPVGGEPVVDVESPRSRSLAAPLSALVTLGSRTFIYVESEDGLFEPREALMGRRTDRFAQVLVIPQSGRLYPHLKPLRRGDRIVVSGAFLIDGQLQLQGKLSAFAPWLPHGSALVPAELFLNDYLHLARFLSQDRLEHGPEIVSRMRDALETASGVEALDGEAGEAATARLVEIAKDLASTVARHGAADLAEARKLFAAMGPAVLHLVRSVHGAIYGASEIRLFEDPGSGRVWAQRDEAPANPFRGFAGQALGKRLDDGTDDAPAASGSGGTAPHVH